MFQWVQSMDSWFQGRGGGKLPSLWEPESRERRKDPGTRDQASRSDPSDHLPLLPTSHSTFSHELIHGGTR